LHAAAWGVVVVKTIQGLGLCAQLQLHMAALSCGMQLAPNEVARGLCVRRIGLAFVGRGPLLQRLRHCGGRQGPMRGG
jgi:hypothetical protein